MKDSSLRRVKKSAHTGPNFCQCCQLPPGPSHASSMSSLLSSSLSSSRLLVLVLGVGVGVGVTVAVAVAVVLVVVVVVVVQQ